MNSTDIEQKTTKIHELLKEKGFADPKIVDILTQLDMILYRDVMDAIIDQLDDAQYSKIDAMIRDGKSTEEIVNSLPLSEDLYNEMYLKKADEIVEMLSKSVDAI